MKPVFVTGNIFGFLARLHTKHNLSDVPHLAHPTISPSSSISSITIKLLSVISAIDQRISISTSICLQSRSKLVCPASFPLTISQRPCLNTLPSLRNAIAVVQLYHRTAELLWSRSLKIFSSLRFCVLLYLSLTLW